MPKTNHQATEKPVHPGELPFLLRLVTPEALVEFWRRITEPSSRILPSRLCLIPNALLHHLGWGVFLITFCSESLLKWILARVKTDISEDFCVLLSSRQKDWHLPKLPSETHCQEPVRISAEIPQNLPLFLGKCRCASLLASTTL